MKRPILSILIALLIVTQCSGSAIGQASTEDATVDTTIVDLDATITVVGRRITGDRTPFPFEKEHLNDLLSENGFNLITKGVFLAQDVQADGFKRDDITIVVDGERYHSACPNRMDSPLARSNSLEMEAIELNKTSSACCAGLGGSIAYRRMRIGDSDRLRAGMSQSLGGYEASDIGFAGTTHYHRIAGRYATGSEYTDGDDRTFVERYNYRKAYDYRLAEVSLTGVREQLQYRVEYTYTDDVMFPYLHMDERLNRVFSGSLAYRGHKFYVNYTDHLMDNGLRRSMGSMITEATNLTLGLIGSGYELIYRSWEADNEIVTPMVTIENALMPSVSQVAASGFYEGKHRSALYWGRLGLSHFSLGDDDRAPFYEPVAGDHGDAQTFVTLGVGVSVRKGLSSDWMGIGTIDVVTEPPSAQSLYIAVQKPMGKPYWSGNPNLRQPVRASVRGRLQSEHLSLEGSASHVWDYVDMTSVMAAGRAYKTYENFDALMLALSLSGEWRYLKAGVTYNWAERSEAGTPVAEIAPLRVSYTLYSPQIAEGQLFWRHVYNDAQTRVDLGMYESSSEAWNRVDVGLTYDLSSMRLNLTVENLFDEFYAEHLSYLRDPFASGVSVYEPGRSVRLSLVLDTPEK